MVEREARNRRREARRGAQADRRSGHDDGARREGDRAVAEGVARAERKLDEAVGPRMEVRGGHSIQAGGNELDDR